jgi:two-component system LytT family response regulator
MNFNLTLIYFTYFYTTKRGRMEDRHEILALIIEDDPLNSNMLKDLLNDHFPNIRIAGIAESIHEARTLLKCLTIDLLFLDIELPDGKGFDLLSAMPEVHFEVIVTTSHGDYALDAIRHSALDFLIKPVTHAELSNALARFMKKFESWKPSKKEEPHQHPQNRKLPLPTLEGFVFVNFEDIVHAEADRSYSLFSLIDRTKIMVSKPLGDFEERLLNRNFIRVHKSHIINLGLVSKYVRGEGGHVIMTNGATVPVSHSRKDEFLRAIGSL